MKIVMFKGDKATNVEFPQPGLLSFRGILPPKTVVGDWFWFRDGATGLVRVCTISEISEDRLSGAGYLSFNGVEQFSFNMDSSDSATVSETTE